MESLLYFLFWALIFYLMMRTGCGPRTPGNRHSPDQRQSSVSDELYWVPPVKDRDPVCGKNIRTRSAKPSVYQGKVYYFCSRECREVFEAAPAIYLQEAANSAASAREHVHV